MPTLYGDIPNPEAAEGVEMPVRDHFEEAARVGPLRQLAEARHRQPHRGQR